MIHVISGEDSFLAAAEESRLADTLVDPAWRAANLAVLDGATASVAEVMDAARTPAFVGARLVVVRDCPWFNPARKSDDAQERDPADAGRSKTLVAALAAGLPDGCHLVLVVPRAVNRTLGTTKALLEAAREGRAEVKEFPAADPFRPERTVSWLVEHARQEGAGMDRDAAEELVLRLGQDKRLLANELRKLASYAGRRAVGVTDVVLLSPPGESDVFVLVETVAARRAPEAVAHLRRLTLNDHPLRILATMATFVRTWLQIKLLAERRLGADDIAAAVKWHPYRVKKALEMLRSWSSGQVMSALQALSEAEQALKGGGLPDDLVMERLLVKLVAR